MAWEKARRWRRSLRFRLVAIVLGAGILPLAITGWLLTQSVRRAGGGALGARLDSTLVRVADDVGNQWVRQRSMLLTVGENNALIDALRGEPDAPVVVKLPELGSVRSEVRGGVLSVTVRGYDGRPRFALGTRDSTALLVATDTAPLPPPGALLQRLDITDAASLVVGSIEAVIELDLTESAVLDPTAGVGAVLGMSDPVTGEAVQPLPFDPALLDSASFLWGGEQWILRRRVVSEPRITLFAAAPLDPYLAPANRLASWALVALAIVGAVVTLVSLWMAARLTRSLVALAHGADAVARGDLSHRMQVTGDDEVSRVGTAFNQMTTNLERTLALLAQRQAIAEVGEFASVLAHEIRNPLSAIRVSLQSIAERVDADARVRPQIQQALADIERVAATATGALRVARSGHVQLTELRLSEPIALAMRDAAPEAERLHAALHAPELPESSVLVRGDMDALHRLFLNLLLNAIHAAAGNRPCGVRVRRSGALIDVTVWDDGDGMSAETRARMFEPFFTTRVEGTGIGLAVVRQIAAAHGAPIQVESQPGAGTKVTVQFHAIAAPGL